MMVNDNNLVSPTLVWKGTQATFLGAVENESYVERLSFFQAVAEALAALQENEVERDGVNIEGDRLFSETPQQVTHPKGRPYRVSVRTEMGNDEKSLILSNHLYDFFIGALKTIFEIKIETETIT
jgi:hypothetical protein